MLFDTHAHLNDEDFNEDLQQVIEKINKENFAGVLNAGYDLQSSIKAVKLANEYENFYASVGMHPHDSKDYTKDMEETFVKLIKDEKKVVAFGEIGLDYHYDNSPRDTQKKVFIRQLKLAEDLGLPVIIHSRDASGDTYEILKKYLGNNTGIIHSCSASKEMVREYLKLGMYISFSGSVTFKNASNLRNSALETDTDKLLIETDCPYLTPVPHRGKRNDPTYVKHTLKLLSELKGIDYNLLEEITTNNAKKIFNIK